LPAYLERQLARLISLVNLWFILWLALSFGGGTTTWPYLIVCGSLAAYWLAYCIRFRRRTGLIYAARYLGGIGLSIVLTMVLLALLQLWLIRPPVDWDSIQVWVFIVAALIVVPVGVLLPPVAMQVRMGSQITTEAKTHTERWLVLENIGYLDTLLLRIPNVRHL